MNTWKSRVDTNIGREPRDVSRLLLQRELGNYTSGGKNFSFIRKIYFSMFPQTTPRYIVVDKQNEKYSVIEFKFHPHCKNGC